jgi:hypothetical protein
MNARLSVNAEKNIMKIVQDILGGKKMVLNAPVD